MQEIRLYNTLHRTLETFEPLDPEQVVMYVCGPTVYDDPHLGHARAAVVFDVLFRLLRRVYGDHAVRYIRNYTDVDDKIIARANERGVAIEAITRQYIAAYEEAVDALGCLRPTVSPRVTEVMERITDWIQQLIDAGAAYEAGGCVFFDVSAFPEYGKLSNRTADDLVTTQRIEPDPRKRSPLDFALWKEARPGEPEWPSPWGPGRPGWHIECTVMATVYGRQTLDIHGGGLDLIFPHHENEIAQCEAVTHHTFARYWVHNGFVRINAEKMSKSLGNFFTVGDLLSRWPAQTLRYFLLSAHYRSPLDFHPGGLVESTKALFRLYGAAALIDRLQTAPDAERTTKQTHRLAELERIAKQSIETFDAALRDDLNTARALGAVFETVREVNRRAALLTDPLPTAQAELVERLQFLLARLRDDLALCTGSAADFFAEWNQLATAALGLDPDEINRQIAERTAARQQRDWARSDDIRDALASSGVLLEDSPDGTIWRVDPEYVAGRD